MAINGQNTRQFKTLWRIIYQTTAAFNIISAIIDVISTVHHVHSNSNEKILIATLLGQLPLAVTSFFLLDGFKRLRVLERDHTIFTKQSFILNIVSNACYFVAGALLYW
jgi:hypothetical protein